jgi:SPP1 family predicted phage head-tail adaptor
MKAGKLDRQLVIERATETIDDAGVAQQTWSHLVTLWGELVANAAADSAAAEGSRTTRTVAFKTRYFGGLTLEDRLTYQGRAHALKDLEEIGRREGLTIKAERIGA